MSTTRVTRQTMADALLRENVEFPPSATVAQLRPLYDELVVSQCEITTDEAGAVPPSDEHFEDARGNEVMHQSAAAVSEEAEARRLKAQIDILRMRREMLSLQQQIRELEDSPQAGNRIHRGVNFDHMENSLNSFTGKNHHDIRKWFCEFEQYAATRGFTPDEKCLGVRRLLKETAKEFMGTLGVVNYNELKSALIETFGRQVTYRDVYRQLEQRRIGPDESCLEFVISMKALAAKISVPESELVTFIIDGFDDESANITLINDATTIADLLTRLDRYQHKRNQHLAKKSVKPSAVVTLNKPRVASTKPKDLSEVRCYNCSKFGHYKSNCTQPVRPPNACFICKEVGHFHNSCPKANQKHQRIVAAVTKALRDDPDSDDEGLVGAISAMQTVGVAFSVNQVRSAKFTKCFSLFDTGSAINIIKRSLVPSGIRISEVLKQTKYIGVGRMKISTYGKIKCFIKFRNVIRKVSLLVLPDYSMSLPLILGRSFLSIFDIHLSQIRPTFDNKGELSLSKSFENVYFSTSSSNKISESGGCSSTGVRLCNKELIDNSVVSVGPTNGKSVDQTDVPAPPDVVVPLPVRCGDGSVSSILEIDVGESQSDVDICPRLSESQVRVLKGVIDTFYLNPTGIECKYHDYKMRICLSDDTPFHCSPRALSVFERREVCRKIKDLMERGIIRRSKSPYASAVVLVKKKNGELRMCIDYRALNKKTIRDNFPLPLIEYCIEFLGNKRWFTLLDLKDGFHQVGMDPDSVQFTSFVTPDGQYEYVKMPFGLKNAPANFQRFLHEIFQDLVEAGKLIIYLDDILIATIDFESHLKVIAEVLRRLHEKGLELKLNKCKFGYNELEYLGYSVNASGIRLTDAHIQNIKYYPMPSNRNELHRCIGLFSYFRRFVPSFSKICKPLLELLRKESRYDFTTDCMKAFRELRDRLVSAPVLAIYSPERETELHCDASSLGFGSVLMQRQHDKKFHPVAYFSKTATPAEGRYHSFELETLAIIYSLRRFRIYLEGLSFKIITDCNSLTLTLSKKQVNPRIARWALELENYDYTIQHRSGVSMGHVDALSRCHVVAALTSDEVDFHIQAAQIRDPEIKKLHEKLEVDTLEHYELRDGLVFRKVEGRQLLLCVPVEMRDNVIRMVHEKVGHLGIDKCYNKIQKTYWFPNMRKQIEAFIKNCIKCIMYSVPSRSNDHNLYSIPKTPVPFDTVHVDHFGPLPALSSKRKHILVVIDAFTKFVRLYPVNSTSTKEVCASMDKYFSYYSRPRRLVSDRGTCFTSLEFANYLLRNNVEHVKVAVASPQANGQVERVNRVIKAMLSKVSEPVNHADWSVKLSLVEHAINNTTHSSTKESPSKLLFGVEQRGTIIDELTEYLEDRFDFETTRDLDVIRSQASDSIKRSQEYNERYFLKHSVPAKTYTVGDFVVIKHVDTSVGTNKKFIQRYRGPYVIHKVLPNDRYVVRDIDNCQLTQLPYDNVIEAARIRRWVTQTKDPGTTTASSRKQH